LFEGVATPCNSVHFKQSVVRIIALCLANPTSRQKQASILLFAKTYAWNFRNSLTKGHNMEDATWEDWEDRYPWLIEAEKQILPFDPKWTGSTKAWPETSEPLPLE
jgi:hypothetical protein